MNINLLLYHFVNIIHFIIILLTIFLFGLIIFLPNYRIIAAIILLLITVQPMITGSCVVTDVSNVFEKRVGITHSSEIFFNKFMDKYFGINFNVTDKQELWGRIFIIIFSLSLIIFEYFRRT